MAINPPCHFIIFDQFSLHSKHFCAILLRKLGREHKKEDGGGERKKPLPANPQNDFKKLLSPTSAASDLCFDVSVDCIAINASIKLDMFCLCASQI